MASSLYQKIVFITGASSGFGAETARLFAEAGARLILAARREDRLDALAKELYQLHRTESYVMPLDVTDYAAVEDKLNALPKGFWSPDILINNAGLVRGMDKEWEGKPQEWDEVINTNIKGVLNVTKQIVPRMLEAKKGHIINIGSISGHLTYPGGSVYCATKFAVRALTDTLRMELLNTPVHVSLISPGMAETEFTNVRFYGDEKRSSKTYEGMTPLSSKDIAEAILFIASRPEHVNIADLIIYPKDQASTTMIYRRT